MRQDVSVDQLLAGIFPRGESQISSVCFRCTRLTSDSDMSRPSSKTTSLKSSTRDPARASSLRCGTPPVKKSMIV